MFNFYKDNMRLVHKFLLNQFAFSLFGFMVIITVSSFDAEGSNMMELIATAVAALLFLGLLYDNAWDAGAHDKNKITNGRMEFKPFYGTLVALVSYIPTAVFALLGLITGILNLFDVHVFDSVGFVCNTIAMFVGHGMYLGYSGLFADAAVNSPYYSLFHAMFLFVLMIPAIVAYALGYYLGAKDKQIKTLFGAAPTNDAPRKKDSTKNK